MEEWEYLALPITDDRRRQRAAGVDRPTPGDGMAEITPPVVFDTSKRTAVGVAPDIRRLLAASLRHLQRMLLPSCAQRLASTESLRPGLERVREDARARFASDGWKAEVAARARASEALARKEARLGRQLEDEECDMAQAPASRQAAAKAHRKQLLRDLGEVEKAVEIAGAVCRRVEQQNAEALVAKLEAELSDLAEEQALYERVEACGPALRRMTAFDRHTLADVTKPPAIEPSMAVDRETRVWAGLTARIMAAGDRGSVSTKRSSYVSASFQEGYDRSFVVRAPMIAFALSSFKTEEMVLQAMLRGGKDPTLPDFACELVKHSEKGKVEKRRAVH